jgi:Uncharacterized protein conserved in bacteria
MSPKIIEYPQITIAGMMGDGMDTAKLWEDFTNKNEPDKINDNAYEVRFNFDNKCDCFVGYTVSEDFSNNDFEILTLPASKYVVFDVIVVNGYDSENENMTAWLEDNKDNYSQAKIDGKAYVVEVYTERFNDGIVEIWIPLNKIHE